MSFDFFNTFPSDWMICLVFILMALVWSWVDIYEVKNLPQLSRYGWREEATSIFARPVTIAAAACTPAKASGCPHGLQLFCLPF